MKKSFLTFLGVLVVVALLAAVAYWGADLVVVELPSVSEGVRLGLDLVGGSAITYEAQIPAGMSQSDIDRGMDSAEAMLRARLTAFNYTEAQLSRVGTDRIRVEIPNISNPEEAVSLLGSTARLEFRDADGNVIIHGSDVKNAVVVTSPIEDGGIAVPHVVMTLNDNAREAFRAATQKAAASTDGKNYISIFMDDEEKSSPSVDAKYAANGIDSAEVSITVGSVKTTAVEKSAKELADLINIGQLPFELKDVELRTVGATLGERSLETSLLAGAIGLGLVILFMAVIYRLPGLMADIALIFYAAMMVVLLALLNVNLSLPGIAGIILSIGMAVDANVIIFERLKEELRSGKTLRSAIESGYKRALAAIIDGNITTIIAALVLLFFGTGGIVGFATTLLIGVLLSMFTVLVVSRILLNSMVGMKITNIKAYGA